MDVFAGYGGRGAGRGRKVSAAATQKLRLSNIRVKFVGQVRELVAHQLDAVQFRNDVINRL